MSDDRSLVRRVAWREVFPWLALLRAFRMAVSPTVLLVATLGVFVSSLGWQVAPYLFLTKEQQTRLVQASTFTARSDVATTPAPSLAGQTPPAIGKYFPAELSGLDEPFFELSEPVGKLLSYQITINETAYYLFGFLWSLAVWAFVGGFITRRAVVQTAIEDTPGLVETAQFAFRRWLWYFLAPLYPLLGVLILLLLHVPLGWLMRIDIGVAVAGFAWIFVLLVGVAAAWLLIGTLLGWPLMWGALSAEREGDAFEAFSRSFSYIYSRPLHYLFYAVVAALLGALGFALAFMFVQVLFDFGLWAVSWGAGRARVDQIRELMETGQASQPLGSGVALLSFWRNVVQTFLNGYVFAYFWSAVGIIYLLLRYDADEKEMDEIYLPDDEPATGPPQRPPTPSVPAGPSTVVEPPSDTITAKPQPGAGE
jgi:hypothetical protein